MLHETYAGFKLETRTDGVAILTFDNPAKMNGFSASTKRDLMEALLQLQYDKQSRVVIFAGNDKAFSAGDSFGKGFWVDGWESSKSQPVKKERTDALGTYGSLRTISQQMIRAVRDLDKLTIAAIDGFAIQSGLTLALACDFRIATTRARLGSATLRMGFMPDEGGHHLLVQHIGVARTMDFLMRKRIVSGDEALAMGLVHECVAPDALMGRALELALELAEGPQVAMRLLKRAIYNAADLTFAQACEDIATRAAIADHEPATAEGVAAFREKRKPDFKD